NYYVKESYYLTEEAKSVINQALNIINSYNFDDSDSQIDYFHTNFYTHMSIGKWDKPFTIKK
ncbi:MAG: molecular chaperone DnaJ, partial [Acetivibrionales bacterium]